MPVKRIDGVGDVYDVPALLCYDAPISAVVGARGLGKTFGMREQFLRDWRKRQTRFAAVTRYKGNLNEVARNYMSKVLHATKDKALKDWVEAENIGTQLRGSELYIGNVNSKGKLDNAELMGYFAALTEQVAKKETTYEGVARIVMDEFLIPRTDRYHGYLRNEYDTLANLVDTISRERAGSKRAHVYLMANAVDVFNPYFERWGVPLDLPSGTSWHQNKLVLIDNVSARAYARDKSERTLAGRMLQGSEEARVASGNEFVYDAESYVDDLPRDVTYMMSVVYRGKIYHVYKVAYKGLLYASAKVPTCTPRVIALTKRDGTPNYRLGKIADSCMRTVISAWAGGMLRFDGVRVREAFFEIFDLFGVK